MKKLSLNQVTIGLPVVVSADDGATVYQITYIEGFRIGIVPMGTEKHATQWVDVGMLNSPNQTQLSNYVAPGAPV